MNQHRSAEEDEGEGDQTPRPGCVSIPVSKVTGYDGGNSDDGKSGGKETQDNADRDDDAGAILVGVGSLVFAFVLLGAARKAGVGCLRGRRGHVDNESEMDTVAGDW